MIGVSPAIIILLDDMSLKKGIFCILLKCLIQNVESKKWPFGTNSLPNYIDLINYNGGGVTSKYVKFQHYIWLFVPVNPTYDQFLQKIGKIIYFLQ